MPERKRTSRANHAHDPSRADEPFAYSRRNRMAQRTLRRTSHSLACGCTLSKPPCNTLPVAARQHHAASARGETATFHSASGRREESTCAVFAARALPPDNRFGLKTVDHRQRRPIFACPSLPWERPLSPGAESPGRWTPSRLTACRASRMHDAGITRAGRRPTFRAARRIFRRRRASPLPLI